MSNLSFEGFFIVSVKATKVNPPTNNNDKAAIFFIAFGIVY